MTSRSEVHHANHYTIEASYKKGQIFHVEVYNVLLFCEVKIKMHVTYNEWTLIEITHFMTYVKQFCLSPQGCLIEISSMQQLENFNSSTTRSPLSTYQAGNS